MQKKNNKKNTCIACMLSTSENYKIINIKTVNINYSFTNILISSQHLISRRVDRRSNCDI